MVIITIIAIFLIISAVMVIVAMGRTLVVDDVLNRSVHASRSQESPNFVPYIITFFSPKGSLDW